jgi:hypothetical protein
MKKLVILTALGLFIAVYGYVALMTFAPFPTMTWQLNAQEFMSEIFLARP